MSIMHVYMRALKQIALEKLFELTATVAVAHQLLYDGLMEV